MSAAASTAPVEARWRRIDLPPTPIRILGSNHQEREEDPHGQAGGAEALPEDAPGLGAHGRQLVLALDPLGAVSQVAQTARGEP